jgi:hypothetical protein
LVKDVRGSLAQLASRAALNADARNATRNSWRAALGFADDGLSFGGSFVGVFRREGSGALGL